MEDRTTQGTGARDLRLLNTDMSALLTVAVRREVSKGEALVKEGELCRSIFLVEAGYLRTYYNKEGIEVNLNFTFEGAFTTNFKAVKSRKASEYTIEAGEDGIVWVFNFDNMTEEQKSDPKFAIFVRRLAIHLLIASEEHSNLFKMYTPTERYHYIEENNPQLLQRISLSQIASYLGVTRETLSRIRGKRA